MADFWVMKKKYKNSCIFDYSIASVAKKFNFSRNKVRRIVAIFIREGWCRWHCGNLIFNTSNALNRLYTKANSRFFNIKFTSKKDAYDKIRQHAVLNFIKQRSYVVQRTKEARPSNDDLVTLKQHKASIKFLTGFNSDFVNGKKQTTMQIPLSNMAKKLNRSNSFVALIIKSLKESEQIIVTPQWVKLGKVLNKYHFEHLKTIYRSAVLDVNWMASARAANLYEII